jgi:signal transduction histidine kinase
MRPRTVAIVITGSAAAVVTELVSVAQGGSLPLSLVDGVVGITAFAAAAAVLAHRRSGRMALLLAATGIAWLAGTVVPQLVFAHRGPLTHLCLSYPTGRLRRSLDVLIGVIYVTMLLPVLAGNPWVSIALAALLVAGALIPSAGEYGSIPGPRVARLVAPLSFAAALILSALNQLAGLGLDRLTLWVYDIAVVTALLAITVGLIRFQHSAAVTDLVVDLGSRTGILTDALSRSLNDPGLMIGYWVPELGRFVNESGNTIDEDRPGPGRVVTPITSAGQPMAILIHDQNVLQEPELVEAVAAGTRLAVANARLQAEARERLDQLTASRRRIVEAGDVQRERLELELRTGVQHRLTRVADLLTAARAEPSSHPELLDQLRDGLVEARAEVAELARGLHPRLLTEHGLAAALAALPSAVKTTLEVETYRLPPAVEAAIYFACSEAVANVAKHSGASEMQIRVTSAGGIVTATIVDNGMGGADVSRGSGLTGIRDRVEALGGWLAVAERVGGGTVVTATFLLPAISARQEHRRRDSRGPVFDRVTPGVAQ